MDLATTGLERGDDLSALTVAVYGLGKMGLPLAAVLADHGATVHGVDIDDTKVRAVNDGRSPVSEPGLQSLLDSHAGSRLTATTDGTEAATDADVMVVLVPTVLDDRHEPDLSPVLAAAETISEGLGPGNLVVLESTVPPGTTAGQFAERLQRTDLEAGVDFGVAHCPERTSSGRVIKDLTESYPKIVGAMSEAGTKSAASFYRTFNAPGVVELPSAMAAEAVKVFEGVYRDVNIALANELALACEEWGLDARTVFDAANTQPYCDLHDPGIGVGGHCIPVYPHFVINRADETPLLETARRVNDNMPEHAVAVTGSLLRRHGVSLHKARVLVLGLTYRPGVEETRYAPAIELIDRLIDRGSAVGAHDPLLDGEAIAATGATPVTDITDGEWDAVVLATGHESYSDLDLNALRAGLSTPVLIDGRDFFDTDDVEAFTYACLGDGTTSVHRATSNQV